MDTQLTNKAATTLRVLAASMVEILSMFSIRNIW